VKSRAALVAVSFALFVAVVPFAVSAFGLLWSGLALSALGSAAIFTVRRRNANARKDVR